MGRARRPLQCDARVPVTKFARQRPPQCTLCEQRAGLQRQTAATRLCGQARTSCPFPR